MIPRAAPPQVDRVRVYHQPAPVKIPVMPEALRRRADELDDAVSDGEEEDDDRVRLPPHEVVSSRDSPMLACSVLEGTGRTLKGRDLRQKDCRETLTSAATARQSLAKVGIAMAYEAGSNGELNHQIGVGLKRLHVLFVIVAKIV
ncbi:hypothetical protein SASPL_104712 [Salvia splendens]|uniref:Uncharacterized protein n=1 Tax=Salvia splendens TaxID=180675 RepID=A0A8X8YJY0_SALSN|nr:hypothetical protein SASPL_104712 [Salvia splendens]